MMYWGLDRLDQFRSKGLSGVVAGYVDRPPLALGVVPPQAALGLP
jgi:hypothetical protein